MQDILRPQFIRETAWRSGSALSHSICYDAETQGIRPMLDIDASTSQYLPHRNELIVGILSNIERNQHLRGYVHLMRSDDPDQYTVAAQSPVEQITATDPAYGVAVRAFPTQYNGLPDSSIFGLNSTMLYVWRDVDEIWSRYVVPTSGQAYTSRQVSPRGLPNDGYFLWTVSHQLDSEIVLGGPGQGFWVSYTNTITSGTSYPYSNFLLDRAAPDSTIQLETNGSDNNGQGEVVGIRNTVRDSLSGLARTRIFIATDDGTVAVADEQFSVGAGITGGPKNTHTVDMEVSLPPGRVYEIYAITTDAAGNQTRTDSVFYQTEAFPVGSVNAENCVIQADERDCQVSISWQSEFLQSPHLTIDTTEISTAPDGDISYTIEHGQYTVRLWDGDMLVDDTNVAAVCAAGTLLVDGTCVTEPEVEIEFSAVPVVIRSGDTATIRWDTSSELELSCRITGPGLIDPNDPDTVVAVIEIGTTEQGEVATNRRYNQSRYEIACTESVTGTEFISVTTLEVTSMFFEL